MSHLRIALRMLLRDPAFTLTVVVLLALGIGSTTAIFTLLNSVLFEPLPYPASSRLVWILIAPPRSGAGYLGLFGRDFLDIQERNCCFENVAGYVDESWTVTDGGEAVRLSGARVTPGFFDTLNVHPALGREFRPEEYHKGSEMVVIFSYPFWQRHYGGDPGLIGRRVPMDGISYEVAGVMPPGFPLETQHDMWAPLQAESDYMGHRWRVLRVFGRLKQGASLAQARADMNAIGADLSRRYPEDKDFALTLTTFLEREVGEVRYSLWIFAAAVGCLLLIACSNVASLLLARGAVRVKEMAVRAAVGASRGALAMQLLVESVILALVGGALGFPIAVAGVRAFVAVDARALPRAREIHADPAVILFAFVASLVTGVIFGVVPALRGSQVNLVEALKEGGRGHAPGLGRSRLRRALVIGEVALGVVLLAAAGLLGRSFVALTSVDPGYRVDGVLTMQLTCTGVAYKTIDQCRSFFARLDPALQRIPGVEAAGATNWLPLRSGTNFGAVWLDTQPMHTDQTKIRVEVRLVTPQYFRALGVPLIGGRFFDERDRIDAPKAVLVNETFARELFPHGDALGHIAMVENIPPFAGRIVGIVGDSRDMSLAQAPQRELFVPYQQMTISNQSLVVRTRGDPAAYLKAVQAAIATVDPGIAVYNVKTMRQQVSDSIAAPRMRSVLLGVFSILALVLASLGVYGVIACAVAERRQEIGIRMALGARGPEVRRMVVGAGLKLTAIGLAIGILCAVVATRLIESFLFTVKASDPATYIGTVLVFTAVTWIASYLPARRATRIDPLQVLRDE
ncbi:MAG TPA: ABC transporter permease [Bryobacteraceae bacterium]|nr:ABC transporter permease [Bryobacteraceae bacterium]